jgi:hypothetical protein
MNNNSESKVINSESKYGDDEKFEPWSDINIFFPIASKLVDPLYNLGLTPNMITILSTIFTFLSIYFLHLNKRIHAVVSYIIGYILDCVDGKMARKYNMGSDFGMVLDATSDIISQSFLFGYLFLTRNLNNRNIIFFTIIILTSYIFSISYGLNEAIAAYEATGSDNFYERRKKQLEGKGCGLERVLYDLFLKITEFAYKSYRSCFPTFDKEKIYSKLKILKHFGAGNVNIFICGILLLI